MSDCKSQAYSYGNSIVDGNLKRCSIDSAFRLHATAEPASSTASLSEPLITPRKNHHIIFQRTWRYAEIRIRRYDNLINDDPVFARLHADLL
jgi:hypothetical protein